MTSQNLEAEFEASVRGRARAARAAGQKYFETFLLLHHTYRVWSPSLSGYSGRREAADHGAVLTDVAEEGWRLISAVPFMAQTGAVTKGRIVGRGEQSTVTGGIYVFYVFELTDIPVPESPWTSRTA